MSDLGPGLYELLITEGLRAQLDELAQGQWQRSSSSPRMSPSTLHVHAADNC